MNVLTASMARLRDCYTRILRSELHDRGYVEIHTPVLVHPLPNTNGARLVLQNKEYELRKCMELRLRSALSPDLDAVFELGPCFRPTDQPDALRHPEFYMLELFRTNLEYVELLALTRDLMASVSGFEAIEFEMVDVSVWMKEHLNVDPSKLDGDALRDKLMKCVQVPTWAVEMRPFEVINWVVAEYLEPGQGTPKRPAVLHNYPVCTVCLARRSPLNPLLIERFEVFVKGIEIAHGFTDEMDASDVLTRMHVNGPQFVDEAFIQYLQTGHAPRSGGVGLGLERLLVAFGGANRVSDTLHENQFFGVED